MNFQKWELFSGSPGTIPRLFHKKTTFDFQVLIDAFKILFIKSAQCFSPKPIGFLLSITIQEWKN